ncbi:IclR family transcriptional regulator [Nocardioides sp. Kera G14]|uniref:IclR family transcriptional regulator n=1 Tax=Nocardioides sp. Kera G14 TaxID=2884264 RepID=UPI001D111CD6|nr:IclR family transcriptional regulator [Nocardioides sp. Kera G14]UDY23424.1 IclR family transcriptional regulator [Nocardioides sp. Kera G14]
MARSLDVLGAFDEQHRALTLSELAERAGLSTATALRIVRQLVDGNALTRGEDRRYRIGRRIWDLGLLAPVETDLREVAAPFLSDLHAATRATIHLAVREGEETLYIDSVAGHASVPVVSRVGSRLTLYATGVGKVLLAAAPDDVVRNVLGSLRPITPYTITAPGILARQLDRIRTEGYATTREEMTLGACSVAVPITVDGQVVAALGVVLPDFRRDRERLTTALQVAARGIGRQLG